MVSRNLENGSKNMKKINTLAHCIKEKKRNEKAIVTTKEKFI